MTDARPANCRFRLQDEGKSYPRSSCAACGRGIGTGLGTFCQSALAPGYTPEILASSPEVAALIREAEDRGMERAAEICEVIRTGIANGPMPEGARFDYEQAIRAAKATP